GVRSLYRSHRRQAGAQHAKEPQAAFAAFASPLRQREALYSPRRGARLFAVEAGFVIGEPLFDSESIAGRVAAIGAAISRDYAGNRPLLVGLRPAAATFPGGLARAVTVPCEIDFIAVSRWGDGDGIALEKDVAAEIRDRHVILVDDTIDTGLTLQYVLKRL